MELKGRREKRMRVVTSSSRRRGASSIFLIRFNVPSRRPPARNYIPDDVISFIAGVGMVKGRESSWPGSTARSEGIADRERQGAKGG